MDAKHRTVQLLGLLALLCGSAFALLATRALVFGRVANVWDALDRAFVFALAAYLMLFGIRALDWAKGQRGSGTGKIKWGKVLLGAFLILFALKNHLHPAPNLLKPANDVEAGGMIFGAVLLVLIGVWLLVSGIRAGFGKPIDKSPYHQ